MKNFKLVFAFAICLTIILASSESFSQLTPNTFGFCAKYGYESNYANLIYTLSENIEIDAVVGFKNVSYTVDEGEAPESETSLSFGAWGGYFLTKGDVSPYIGVGVYYSGLPKSTVGDFETTSYNIEAEVDFGMQVFFNKHFAVFGEIKASYNILSEDTKYTSETLNKTTGTFRIFTAAIGACFYL